MKALLWLTVVHEVFLICWPVLYTIAANYRLEREYSLNANALVAVMTGEATFVAMFAIGFLSLGKLRGRARTIRSGQTFVVDRAFIYFLVLSGLVIQLSKFFSPIESFADLTQHAELVVRDSVSGSVGEWLRGALQFPSLVAATITLLVPKVPAWLRVASLVTITAVSAIGVASGVRGRVIWVLTFLVVVALMLDRKRTVDCGRGARCLHASVDLLRAGPFARLSTPELTGKSRFEALARIGEQFTSATGRIETDDEGMVDNFYRRAQGPRNATILYALHDQGRGAGIRPTTGCSLTTDSQSSVAGETTGRKH